VGGKGEGKVERARGAEKLEKQGEKTKKVKGQKRGRGRLGAGFIFIIREKQK
jgi:hypothetical protein